MDAREGELHPFGDVLRVVADPLEILGDHEQVDGLLAAGGVFVDQFHQLVLDDAEKFVDQIVELEDALRFFEIFLHEGVDAAGNHFDGSGGHLRQMNQRFDVSLPAQAQDDFRDIRRLVADAFQIGDHFQRRGDQTQISGDGLLFEQEFETERLDGALLRIDLPFKLERPSGGVLVLFGQRLGGACNGLFRQSWFSCLSNRLLILTKPSRDVIFSPLVPRIGKEAIGLVVLDDLSEQEKRRCVRDAHRLLHVVRHHDDRVFFLQRRDEIFDPGCGKRVESAGGLVHQQHLRLHRQSPGDAQPLLLAAGQAQGRLFQPVLHLVPDGGVPEGLLHDLIQLPPFSDAMGAGAVGDVVIDAHGEGIGLLEHHAHLPAQLVHIHIFVINILLLMIFSIINIFI